MEWIAVITGVIVLVFSLWLRSKIIQWIDKKRRAGKVPDPDTQQTKAKLHSLSSYWKPVREKAADILGLLEKKVRDKQN